MKPAARLLTIFALCCGTVGAQTPVELQPQDFARGRTVSITGTQPFFVVYLPRHTFSETAWPDLRDIRVFNAAAESVPFARLVPPRQFETRVIALQQFRITSGRPGGTPQVEVDARAQGIELRVASSGEPGTGAEYLLAAPEEEQDRVIERLRLSWRDHAENWQQRVSVSVSRDLANWSAVAIGRPIMDLKTDEGERLRQDEIEISAAARESGRYWRIRFEPG